MKQNLIRLLNVGMLISLCLPMYGLDFFGIEIGGSLDEMTSRLEKDGYEVVMVTPQKGPDKGKEVVFGNDKFRCLKKFQDGDTTALTIYMGDKGVNNIVLENKSARTIERMGNYYASLLGSMIEAYGSPDMNYSKKNSSLSDKEIIKEIFGNEYDPAMASFWSLPDGVVQISVELDTPSCKAMFYKK